LEEKRIEAPLADARGSDRSRDREGAVAYFLLTYFFTGAGVAALAGAVFTVFLTAFLCFLVVVAAAAGLEAVAGAAGAGAGVCAAKVRGTAARAKAKVKIVVFIFFLLAGLVARSQFHTALQHAETR
jgi:hypothetical protein